MTRRAAPALVLVLAACGGGSGAGVGSAPAVQVSADATGVDLGRAFRVTVVRSWGADLVPEAWSDRALEPLVVRAADVRRDETAGRVEETRVFRAYAFAPGRLTVPPLTFVARPRAGGEAVQATGPGLDVDVRATLDTATAAVAELPETPLRVPFPWRRALALAAAAAAVFVATLRYARRGPVRRPAAPAAAPRRPRAQGPDAARDRALDRLAALRGRACPDRAANDAFHVEVADSVREWATDGLGVATRERTTEEIVAAATERAAVAAPGLADVLGRCDVVKFGGGAADGAARERLLDAAESCVRSAAGEARP